MKRDLFRRYVWLIDTVRHAKKVQFEEIADKWLTSAVNEDKSPLALRTFHNHRHAIESLFGIKIECDRSDHHRYYIHEEEGKNSTRLKIWMLQRLGYSDIDNDLKALGNRIILDSLPEDKCGLYDVIQAMQDNNVLNIVLSEPMNNGKESLFYAPYGIKFTDDKWHVIGKDIETGDIHNFRLESLKSIALTHATFICPKDFSIAE